MGFSGKPSKGCAPCRQKRTKCDLAQPFCTQCVRKNRICSGYRDENDMRFVNETKLVVRKATRRTEDQPQPSFSIDRFIVEMLNVQQPSRLAALDDEATMHFLANYNKKFFPAECQPGESGFDYMTPLYQKDSVENGPVSEIIRASGLAALGNKGNPKLLVAARAKQVKVLRQLNQQLQDPKTAYSESSLLTCVMLGVFENIIWDSPESMYIRTAHVQGAVTLAELIGPSKIIDAVGRGIYLRIRENMLGHCFLAREPLPKIFLETEGLAQKDYDHVLWGLFARLCQVRYDRKMKGLVDDNMVSESQAIMNELEAWERSKPYCETSVSKPTVKRDESPHHYVWLWTLWMLHQTSRILASEIVIDWAKARVPLTPSDTESAKLDNAISTHVKLCRELRERTELQLIEFRRMNAGIATVASYDCFWPLFILASSSTCDKDTLLWSIKSAEMIGEEFGVRQAKIFVDGMRCMLLKFPNNP